MRTLLALLLLVGAPLAALSALGTPPAAFAQDAPTQPCISDEPLGDLPRTFEIDGQVVECLAIADASAIFGSSVPMQVTLAISATRWAEADRAAGPIVVTQWRDGAVLYVTLTRTIVPADQVTFAPHTQSVALDGLLETGSHTLRVNNLTLTLSIPAQAPTSAGEPPSPPADDGAGLIRSYATIQTVQVSADRPAPARITLYVSGTHAYPGGECASPLQVRQSRTGDRVDVELFRLIDTTLSCPTERERISETIRLRGSFEPGTYQLRVNSLTQTMTIPLTPPPPPPPPPYPIRRDAVIESVAVLRADHFGYPVRLTLHVTGYLPDGCGGPLQIEQWRRGDRVHVAIYQFVDPRLMCTMMLQRVNEYIPLEGTFGPGTYAIAVNDYWLWYTLPPGDPWPVPLPGAEF